MRLDSGDSNLSGALRPLVTRGDPRLGKRPCSLAESPYRPLYTHITRRPARLCYCIVAVVVVVATALVVQSILAHRPLVARTELPRTPFTTTPQSPRQTNPDSLSLLSLAAQQSTPLLSILSILPLLQVRTATGRDSPDRYDNLIDLAPLLHRSQSFLEK
jgi:hypothetical protein